MASQQASNLNRLEVDLLNKMRERIPSRSTEEQFIMKAFKQHDLQNTGYADFARFKRSLEPFAPHLPEQVFRDMFARYAEQGKALVNYRDFAVDFVSGDMRDPALAAVRRAEIAAEPPNILGVLSRIKEHVEGLGANGLVQFALELKNADVANIRALPYGDFASLMRRGLLSPIALEGREIDLLFSEFRTPHNVGQMSYDEMILALKTPLSAARRDAVRKAFRRLNDSGEDIVSFEALLTNFNAGRHPKVVSKQQSEHECVSEFAGTLEDVLAFRRGPAQHAYAQKVVGWEEFEDVYAFVNGGYADDASFIETLTKVWDLDKPLIKKTNRIDPATVPAAGVMPDRRLDLHHWAEQTLAANHAAYRPPKHPFQIEKAMDRLRRVLVSTGIKSAVHVVKAMLKCDDDRDGHLDQGEFRKACDECRVLRVTPEEETHFFRHFGQEFRTAVGRVVVRIPVAGFLSALWGPLTDERHEACVEAWEALCAQCNVTPGDAASVPLGSVLDRFNATQHPLVEQGRADARKVQREFIEAFAEYIRCTKGQLSNAPYSALESTAMEEVDFVSFYVVQSALIDNDAFFNVLVRRVWGVGDMEVSREQQSKEDKEIRPSMTAQARRNSAELELFRDNKYYSRGHNGKSVYQNA